MSDQNILTMFAREYDILRASHVKAQNEYNCAYERRDECKEAFRRHEYGLQSMILQSKYKAYRRDEAIYLCGTFKPDIIVIATSEDMKSVDPNTAESDAIEKYETAKRNCDVSEKELNTARSISKDADEKFAKCESSFVLAMKRCGRKTLKIGNRIYIAADKGIATFDLSESDMDVPHDL